MTKAIKLWGALFAAALLWLPASASAAPRFKPCSGRPDVDCGRVVVPYDQSGVVRGGLSLHVERMHTGGSAKGALIALAGGPGQAATPFLPDFRVVLDPILHGRDLVVYDQRGTGSSNELLCRGLGSHKLPDLGVGNCAKQLGAIRGFFSTSESVSDIEAVRRAIGVDKIDLYGVSYGTKVALDYAIRFPNHVDRLVLDSVVLPGALDAYELSSFAAVPRILRQICAKNGCRGITNDPVGDLSNLVNTLVNKGVRGSVVNGHGKLRSARLRRSAILQVLFEGDFDPVLRSDFPAAVKAGLAGDAAPMLRLMAGVRGSEDLTGGDSEALFAATSCEDSNLAWDPAGSPSQRVAQARAQFNAIPPSSYAPFDPATVFKFSLAPFCASWPEAGPNPPVEENPLPNVPTLLLSGTEDLRTPNEDAAKLASELPNGTLVKVPSTGHSVVGSDLFNCATKALQTFFRGQPPRTCKDHGQLLPPSPVPPRSLNKVPRIGGLQARPGRTLVAVRLTLADMFERALDGLLNSSDGFTIAPVGGLRAGWFEGGERGLRLHGYSWVPGVTVTGRVPFKGKAKLKIGGHSAARGTLTIDARGRISGRLGSQKISGRFLAAAAEATQARNIASGLWQRRFEPFAGSVLLPG
ncbi:MAG TPA: alpha/beta hydrolase [Candidatus Dormibacteraeota bacterium]|nr:alpha/beta hydrolase [Candidatus Dormibacteraeota bacterium]